ncbi:MAG TPA: hypothetical protein VMS82_04850, partial [Pseudolabrys sp.]|nr:hypothetical protein [Pseudolabrys sp.]
MKPIPSLAGEGLGNKNDGRDRSYSPLRTPSNPTASEFLCARIKIAAQSLTHMTAIYDAVKNVRAFDRRDALA